jgi:hypothetical protein
MTHNSLREARHLTPACSRRASRAADAERSPHKLLEC